VKGRYKELSRGNVQSLPWQVIILGALTGAKEATKPRGMARWLWMSSGEAVEA
jgi:hypothetical protein